MARYDHHCRDRMGLVVSRGFSGLAAFGRAGKRNDQIILGVEKDGTRTFKFADVSGDKGTITEVHKGASLKVLAPNPTMHKLEDIAASIVY